MRTVGQQIALMRYNAERCEKSKYPRCACACGGTKHGQPHGADWIREQETRIRELISDDLRAKETAEGRPGLFP
jgi:hypothetical protein